LNDVVIQFVRGCTCLDRPAQSGNHGGRDPVSRKTNNLFDWRLALGIHNDIL